MLLQGLRNASLLSLAFSFPWGLRPCVLGERLAHRSASGRMSFALSGEQDLKLSSKIKLVVRRNRLPAVSVMGGIVLCKGRSGRALCKYHAQPRLISASSSNKPIF